MPEAALWSGPSGRLDGVTVVYGGSFDPPHMGHQMACLVLLEAWAAHEIWLVPTYRHAFGKALAPFADRYAMCRHLVAPFDRRVSVSRVEEELGGESRTYETLAHLRARHPGRRLALAVGADLVAEMPRWHRFADLAREVQIVVVGRAGYPRPDILVELPAISSALCRERIEAGLPVRGMLPAAVEAYVVDHAVYPRPPVPPGA